jgi:hypothetical protein
MSSLGVLAVLLLLNSAQVPHAQEDNPATSCDFRKAGLDPAKFHLYLTKDTPYTSWPLWPGSAAMTPTKPPHGPFRTTRVNPAALRSIEAGSGMDFGSLVVMEDLGPGGKLLTLSAMLKIKGYHPEAGDWHWFQYDANGAVLACGRTAVCIGCHGSRRENGYIMTAPVK